ncbi:MAG: hypothetical protein WAW91_00785, partial [Candidatus Nanoperiomorbaceae bacterium]
MRRPRPAAAKTTIASSAIPTLAPVVARIDCGCLAGAAGAAGAGLAGVDGAGLAGVDGAGAGLLMDTVRVPSAVRPFSSVTV